MILHKRYLPFSEDQLRSHFAHVKKNGRCIGTADKHIKHYKRSIENYNEYTERTPNRNKKPISELKKPFQIEKDEKFWTASCLMTVFHGKKRVEQFVALFKKAYGPLPPIPGIESWEECFEGDLHLFFETNLPSPASYKNWLRRNLKDRQFIPYIVESDNGRKNLEGPTNVDALLINASNGFAVLIEAKILSDISYQITYDVMRNQIARNVDVMLEANPNLCPPLDDRDPEKSLFLLLTPRLFKDNPSSRLYGYKFNEYKSVPASLGKDLSHRTDKNLEIISKRLGWLTWEDFHGANKNCCKWLK
ncbi:MAG: hypothetical protein JRJ11_18050 [Deltaproteobacteria bacterium]|nr:hypothetical protein [Deltaproteobacteria bacterium]MBW1911414.1 hypothetical protein [Deltaproteobacteria bacterium]MBW2358787.1 hypothetical protein [Deltaproteobacteria bacterium]